MTDHTKDHAGDLGSYVERDDRPAVRFERVYPHPITRVWQCLTEPAELRHWFPSPDVTIEPRVGGRITLGGDPYLDDRPSTVLIWDPPSAFSFQWGRDELHFRLTAVSEATTRLELVDVLEARDAAARNAGGWLVCLGELAKTIDGRPGAGPHSDDVIAPWPDVYGWHVAAGLPSGAEIPDPA